MTSRPAHRTGRSLLRLAVAGAVVIGTPIALAGTANATPESVWDSLASCESGGRWDIHTGNGFSGGLQFSPTTWRAFGGTGEAWQNSRATQIAVAERILAAQGFQAWPSCSNKLGLSGKGTPPSTVRASAPAPAAPAAPTAAPAKSGATYTVAAGDTLSKIAASNGVAGGWQALFAKNSDVLSSPNALRIGQQIAL
jgi:LysM repeat protein